MKVDFERTQGCVTVKEKCEEGTMVLGRPLLPPFTTLHVLHSHVYGLSSDSRCWKREKKAPTRISMD